MKNNPGEGGRGEKEGVGENGGIPLSYTAVIFYNFAIWPKKAICYLNSF